MNHFSSLKRKKVDLCKSPSYIYIFFILKIFMKYNSLHELLLFSKNEEGRLMQVFLYIFLILKIFIKYISLHESLKFSKAEEYQCY